MTWLVRDGDVLATVDEATSVPDRLRGLWHRPPPLGALILRPPVVLHTVGLPYAVEVAFLENGADGRMAVTETVRLAPFRVARPRLGAKLLVVATDGAFERWRLTVGDELEISGRGNGAG
ncbi:MAG TPA: DUF192 domain-containing protein [Acidimicrobiales bacterium]|jgi:hypothetical protein|nr:DUF192 domain-containing protein [Acidimicrobiales bacterium]